jgi:hypothetical protein
MITRTIPLLILPALAALADERQDMLRFTNGDQLRGRFDSIHEGPVVKWLHDDLTKPAEFKTSSIHQLVFREGQPQQVLRNLSHVELANRDRLPGVMISLDENKITLDTEYAGIIHIPRDHISIIAPNPMGGRVHYSGPFAADEWKVLDNNPDAGASQHDNHENEGKPAGNSENWQFTGSSWIWKGKAPGPALTRTSGMPAHTVIRFDISWKNRLGLAVALHADFARPDDDPEIDANRRRGFNVMDANNQARVFGNSNILHLHSQYLNCITTRVDENGKIDNPRRQNTNHNIRLGEAGKARIEIRSNRNTGNVILFINDEFSAQWNTQDENDEGLPSKLTGDGLGFMALANDTHIRISDIIICEWNGMPDSARSLQTEDQDIVLMTNGTDRYAGKAGQFTNDGILEFDGKYGSFKLPLDEIAEIRFARNSLASIPQIEGSGILLRMGPIGAISGTPVSSDPNTIEIINPSAGKMQISFKPVTLIDFHPNHVTIDDWNYDF